MKFFPRHSSCRVLLPLAVFGLLLSVATPVSWAQKDMGSIVGNVKDGTGAVVADAKVAIADVDRGTGVNTVTNASGEFVSGPLRIGQYTVTVEKSGFKKAVSRAAHSERAGSPCRRRHPPGRHFHRNR